MSSLMASKIFIGGGGGFMFLFDWAALHPIIWAQDLCNKKDKIKKKTYSYGVCFRMVPRKIG